jgi:NAD(P)-dependent dehydrogenase (short-subunit alcohol dehydrogenase family)
MADYRFDGRVAVVTGAGRGLGRAYARLLASRGAQVVVNDIGGSVLGDGHDDAPAQSVVSEIRLDGGDAVADANDIATIDGSQAVIASAIDHFGRIDIVVNNAGILQRAGLPEVDLDNVRRHVDVHVLGAFNMLKAAWSRFTAQSYGRVVLTTSTGFLGSATNTGYATAKAGVIGLARSARIAGEGDGIKVNVISPVAQTRMASPAGSTYLKVPGADLPEGGMPADAAAPMVAYLAHESCPVNGEVLVAGARRFARIFIGHTEGYLHDGPDSPTIEDVAANFEVVVNEAGYYAPADLQAWTGRYFEHLNV